MYFTKDILCCLLLLLSSSTIFSNDKPIPTHEFHISKCLIEYNETEKALQMTLHLFIDDLELALKQAGSGDLFICTEKEAERAEVLIYQYLKQKLAIALEDKKVDYTFLGKEMSEDMVAVWCYLEVENVESFKKLHVSNRILIDTFDDQKNITSIVGPKKKKGYLLFDSAKNEETLNF
ncbi:MAG: DUF6702 family protein [Bacteroidota bacterium]